MDENGFLSAVSGLIGDHPEIASVLGGLGSVLLGSGIFSFLRRPKADGKRDADYLSDEKLLSPPTQRPAYSDRMAYVLAELSALAYYEFEGTGARIAEAAKSFSLIAGGDSEKIEKWLGDFADRLLLQGIDSEDFLRAILESRGFELLGTINVAETQAFVCKRLPRNDDGHSFVVVAFRGTEKKVSDWLTDADATPFEYGVTAKGGTKKVHSGFLNALTKKTDSHGQTAISRLRVILETKGVDEKGQQLPLFLTGHSLGGALALLMTVLMKSDMCGACYTFGAPRIANYEFFENVKTPVFRVVNSADIVPRVPPVMVIPIKLCQGLEWATSYVFPPVSRLFERLARGLDRLEGYRHYGDQRYLTDVESGRFSDVNLLSNPPVIDRIMWIGQQLIRSWFVPVKSHGMLIYREKLRFLANDRNQARES
ncbi:lipase family protein [Nisaea sp.]|uniref:lipase family protein n=1 Tax=Nisaea sp. TaxID=2024842 RepID=UPI0032EB3305